VKAALEARAQVEVAVKSLHENGTPPG